jgi:Kef-type K+ transport system membrane component KefB
VRRALLLLLLLAPLVWSTGRATAVPATTAPTSPRAASAATFAPAPAAPASSDASRAPAVPAGGAAESTRAHSAAVEHVLLGLLVILVAAKLGGSLAESLGQPAVLGELLAGVLLGNLTLVGFGGLAFLAGDPGIRILAELGVVLLLFEVGLGSNVREMAAVGWSSLLVACLGVVVPFLLGWALSAWLLPGLETLVHVFIGAILCATSVGITARVLTDLGRVQTREAKIILGAAVIDDVLGLVILAVVTGTVSAANAGNDLDSTRVLWIVAKAAIFLFGSLLLGGWLSPRLMRFASRLEVRGMLLVASLGFCFALAWIASRVGLAPIVGAFAAGLILEDVHFQAFFQRGEHRLEELLQPIGLLLVPVFFVRMGVEVDLAAFARRDVLGFAALLTLAAALGKMACAGGVLERGVDRLTVAVGMVPRGEVGLIFAAMGAQMVLHGRVLVTPAIFSAVVIVVIVTTLVTPPLLAVTLRRGERRRPAPASAIDDAPAS